MPPLNDNEQRLAANHHYGREPASPVVVRRTRHYRISDAVVADTFRPVTPFEQTKASIAYFGARPGTVSLKVAGQRAGFSAERPLRGQPQARLAAQRDRRAIPGAATPGAHEAVGRAVISPLLLFGRS